MFLNDSNMHPNHMDTLSMSLTSPAEMGSFESAYLEDFDKFIDGDNWLEADDGTCLSSAHLLDYYNPKTWENGGPPAAGSTILHEIDPKVFDEDGLPRSRSFQVGDLGDYVPSSPSITSVRNGNDNGKGKRRASEENPEERRPEKRLMTNPEVKSPSPPIPSTPVLAPVLTSPDHDIEPLNLGPPYYPLPYPLCWAWTGPPTAPQIPTQMPSQNPIQMPVQKPANVPQVTLEFLEPTVPKGFVANPNNHGRWSYDAAGNRTYLNRPKNKQPKQK
ncbi:hypothetical protein N7474_006755 [Penicillium riverlandense]|uniref:uncharacterized protein n=1 Tax=Penicillium riverlandense TaxID=1903569 RepID=UPI0025469651|nr:uncharacterized protein N7474_006755 [Penicillium riverlandense]KAJ5814978.1 hypothetical protein N7474_006755 [Penicillium riverlandense]